MSSSSRSLDALARDWLAWKNTAKPSDATLRARTADLAVIGAILCEQVGIAIPEHQTDPLTGTLGPLEPSHIGRDSMVRAFARYAAGHAPASIRRCRSTWSGFCTWMVIHREVLDANPIDYVEPPRAKRWRPKPIGEDDLTRVVVAAQEPAPKARNPWPELERALCALFVGAGVRVSEAISVRVGDVRTSPTELTKLHVTGKGEVTRTIPLPPEAVDVIDAYLASRKERLGSFRPTDRLLVRVSGQPLTPKAIDHLVSGWFRRAGVAPPPGALAHSLRHTYATLLVEQSGSVPEVQRLLGHADMATTQAYVDVAARGVEEAAMSNPARGMLASMQNRRRG